MYDGSPVSAVGCVNEMTEITEIDMNKYHVMKVADIEKYLSDRQKYQLSLINTSIRFGRIEDGKKEWGNWLVLNLDDVIDGEFLFRKLNKIIPLNANVKIRDIAVALVNAILKAKTE